MNENFQTELSNLVNKYGIDVELSIPDFFIADYLIDSLGSLRELKVKLLNYELKDGEQNEPKP